MTEPTGPNSEQADYWAAEAGPKWIAHETRLDSMLAPVLTTVLDRAAPSAGMAVLDIGCGTGASALALADLVGPQGRVTAADISPPLLARARERAAAQARENVDFIKADPQIFDFGAARFDSVVSRFGVMFFADPTAAFVNIARAMRPGAHLTFAAWSAMEDNPWFRIPFKAAGERLGFPPKPEPRAPGPMAFAERPYVEGLLRAAGLLDVTVERTALHLTPAGDLATFADFAVRIGPGAHVITAMEGTDADARAVAARVAEQFAEYATDDGIRMPATINLCSARA